MRVELINGDISRAEVDVVVAAAALADGDGVAAGA